MNDDQSATPYKMLRNFYFPACLLMWRKHRELWARVSATPAPSSGRIEEMIVYNSYWFASLHVVAEGWRDLKLVHPEIDQIIDAHSDSLRLFRNAVFHFQPKDVKFGQWTDHEKWNWAERLTAAFQSYFSELFQGSPRMTKP